VWCRGSKGETPYAVPGLKYPIKIALSQAASTDGIHHAAVQGLLERQGVVDPGDLLDLGDGMILIEDPANAHAAGDGPVFGDESIFPARGAGGLIGAPEDHRPRPPQAGHTAFESRRRAPRAILDKRAFIRGLLRNGLFPIGHRRLRTANGHE